MNYKIKQAYLKMLNEQDQKKYIVISQNGKYIVQTVDDAIIFTDPTKAKELADTKNKEAQINQQNIKTTQQIVQNQQGNK